MNTKRWCRRFVACLLVVMIVSCSTVPGTGRRQLNLLSPAEEMQLGLTSFEKMKRELPMSKDPAANALVQKVGRRISAVAPLPKAQWEFVVFESKEVNAFCLPGGKVGVYTGILPITQDESRLAAVIGHEVAHAVARHGGERLSVALGLAGIGAVLDSATQERRWHNAAVQVYGIGSAVGAALPHSRLQESEADHLGLLYMARAGYNPEEAVNFWERFADYNRQRGGGQGLWFLRTHPVDETRIRQLKEWLPEAKAQFRTP
jgi:predicted Zn-dependent protease